MTEDYKRIICCLETWIKELEEDDDKDSAVRWVLSTYYNEIKNGEYVDDDEYQEWLLRNSKIY